MPRWPKTVREWLLTFDPGLTRLRLALRATLTTGLALLVLSTLARLTGQPLTAVLLGAVVALLTSMTVSDPGPRAQRITSLLMPIAAAGSIVLGTLAAPSRIASDGVFVVVVFAAVYVRRFGPRGFAIGMLAFITYFFAQFLNAQFGALPALMIAIVIGTVCAGLMRFVILPDRPQRELRLTLRAVHANISQLLDALIKPIDAGRWTRLRRRIMRTRVARLNATILAAENQLERAAEVRLPGKLERADLMLRLFDLELAAERVAAVIGRSDPESLKPQLDGLRRLRAGGRGAPVDEAERTRLAPAVTDLDAALAALPASGSIRIGSRTTSAKEKGGKSSDADDGLRPSTRQAIQVAVASALAIGAGEMVSPSRWYWAAITAFVVFTGTHSRGETLTKGWQRMAGTLAGVLAGVFIATAVGGARDLSLALIFVCIFLAFYSIRFAYGLMIFWITILLALLYGLLGLFSAGLLVLRLEETALGAVIGMLVAIFLLPVRTRTAVRSAGGDCLRTLGNLVETCTRRIAGENAEDPLAQARQLDKQFQQLETTAKPLTEGFAGALNRKGIRRSLRTLMAATYYSRNLARLSQQAGAVPEPLAATLRSAGRRIADNARALAAALARSEATMQPSDGELDRAERELRAADEQQPRRLAALQGLIRLDQLIRDMGRRLGVAQEKTG